jgi:hypothetical protein
MEGGEGGRVQRTPQRRTSDQRGDHGGAAETSTFSSMRRVCSTSTLHEVRKVFHLTPPFPRPRRRSV